MPRTPRESDASPAEKAAKELPAAPSGSPVIMMTQAQLEEMLARVGAPGLSKQDQLDLMEKQAELNAEANRKALRPENATAPGISVFSHPEGDKARPRAFTRKTYWVGAQLGPDCSTAEEMALLEALKPGRYTCTKSDGSKIPVYVEADQDAEGKITAIKVWFQTKDEHRHNFMSQVAMLREILDQQQKVVAA